MTVIRVCMQSAKGGENTVHLSLNLLPYKKILDKEEVLRLFINENLKNKNKHYYFYIHIKKTDTPGHDNKPLEKLRMIEFLDNTLFSFLKDFIKDNKMIITADHTTACKVKNHTADPVPLLSYPYTSKSKLDPERRFTENYSLKGKKYLGKNVLSQVFFR